MTARPFLIPIETRRILMAMALVQSAFVVGVARRLVQPEEEVKRVERLSEHEDLESEVH